MTTLLLIRHGQSQANLTRCFAGHLDAPLTQLGQQQAACTAEFVANAYSVDAVYGSDLLRAFDTVHPACMDPMQAFCFAFAHPTL